MKWIKVIAVEEQQKQIILNFSCKIRLKILLSPNASFVSQFKIFFLSLPNII